MQKLHCYSATTTSEDNYHLNYEIGYSGFSILYSLLSQTCTYAVTQMEAVSLMQ